MASSSNGTERRQFSRIAFDGAAHLGGPGGQVRARVVDICLKGALLELAPEWQPSADHRYRLTLELTADITVSMELSCRHHSGNRAGFVCERIDIDSLCHLRRLAELNLADEQLLQRELSELFGPDQPAAPNE